MNSRACFTVWGRRENTMQFTILNKALEKLGRPLPPAPPRTNFHLSDGKDEMRAEFEKIGFKDVRMWYQPSNWLYRDGKEYVELFLKENPDNKAILDEELMEMAAKIFDEE